MWSRKGVAPSGLISGLRQRDTFIMLTVSIINPDVMFGTER